MIPTVITNLRGGKKIPVYGKGENIRDWLYVGDHVKAIDYIMSNGMVGETYNIGGDNELTNIDLIYKICEMFHELYVNVDSPIKTTPNLPIEYVEDRKGHDLRYGINSTKLKELGWKPTMDFEEGIKKTINFYINE